MLGSLKSLSSAYRDGGREDVSEGPSARPSTTVATHRRRSRATRLAMVVGALALLCAGCLRYGGWLLVSSEPLPEHADVAIALSGSEKTATARSAAAIDLLQEGRVDTVLLSVGAISYYGAWVPDLVRGYLLQEFGPEIADRVVLCEGLADSTRAELFYLARCVRDGDWRSAIVVTSNYHTRRTRLIAGDTLARRVDLEAFAVHGVRDGDFEPQGWWMRRRYAKTWLLETTKLVAAILERAAPDSFFDPRPDIVAG